MCSTAQKVATYRYTYMQCIITDYAPQKIFIFADTKINQASSFINISPTQLFQVSLFTNIFPLQSFPCM